MKLTSPPGHTTSWNDSPAGRCLKTAGDGSLSQPLRPPATRVALADRPAGDGQSLTLVPGCLQ
jgi:hypothetical protein